MGNKKSKVGFRDLYGDCLVHITSYLPKDERISFFLIHKNILVELERHGFFEILCSEIGIAEKLKEKKQSGKTAKEIYFEDFKDNFVFQRFEIVHSGRPRLLLSEKKIRFKKFNGVSVTSVGGRKVMMKRYIGPGFDMALSSHVFKAGKESSMSVSFKVFTNRKEIRCKIGFLMQIKTCFVCQPPSGSIPVEFSEIYMSTYPDEVIGMESGDLCVGTIDEKYNVVFRNQVKNVEKEYPAQETEMFRKSEGCRKKERSYAHFTFWFCFKLHCKDDYIEILDVNNTEGEV